MADTYNVFSKSLFYNPEMAEQYRSSRMKYVTYFTNIIRHIDIYLQEDQLTHTRYGFPVVTVPTYLTNQYKLEKNDIHHFGNAVHAETKEAQCEM